MKRISAFSLLFSFLISGFLFSSVAQAASTEGKDGLLKLGDPLPSFELTDAVSGKKMTPADFADKKALLVMELCRHCPFVQHVKKGVAQLSQDYAGKDVAMVAVSANDPEAYPDDAPAKLKEMAEEEGFQMPFLFDEDQAFSKALTAVATPDFFLFDKDRKLVYRGRMDGARPGSPEPNNGADIRAALDAVLADQPVSSDQKVAVGCSIKWKKGGEPDYWK